MSQEILKERKCRTASGIFCKKPIMSFEIEVRWSLKSDLCAFKLFKARKHGRMIRSDSSTIIGNGYAAIVGARRLEIGDFSSSSLWSERCSEMADVIP